ncbi:phosphotransferase enzyme family [Fusarium longipes]|uniref:Phosphotransferase enzyme family n=1 Tax=Fusarium longipes TaxID=694270 RepID=A0A395SWG2_9HYPO|nr:phosphotransferase enzyme family [Fusarium longipes]
MNPPTPVTLPYFSTAQLPSPLPTTEEIHNAQDKLSPRRQHWETSGVCSVRDYVIKYGQYVGENEGNALLFLKGNNIAIPHLYAMYREASSGHLFLIMERLAGNKLESLWPSLSPQQKSIITWQLRSIYAQIRSLEPPSIIGGVCGDSVPSPLFRTEDPDPRINGPFQTSSELTAALTLVLQEDEGAWISEYLARHVTTVFGDFPVRFTHGDLATKNIIVGKSPTDGSYQVVGLVDFESAGWYPAYWDYVTAIAHPQEQADWPTTVDAVLDPYLAEACVYLLLLRELHFIF